MKRKGGLLLAAMILCLTACSQQTESTKKPIGLDAAKTAALQDASVAESDILTEEISQKTKNGLAYYQVDFSTQQALYSYDVDALTGIVISSTTEQKEAAATENSTAASTTQSMPAQTAQTDALLTEEEAKAAAYSHAGVDGQQVTMVKTELDWERGKPIYEVEFITSDQKEYDYELDGETGEVLAYDYDAEHVASDGQNQQLSEDEAKELALSQVPGATWQDMTEFEVDRDDGRVEYEGTIRYDGMKYEFEIDGFSGAIRSWEAESLMK